MGYSYFLEDLYVWWHLGVTVVCVLRRAVPVKAVKLLQQQAAEHTLSSSVRH